MGEYNPDQPPTWLGDEVWDQIFQGVDSGAFGVGEAHRRYRRWEKVYLAGKVAREATQNSLSGMLDNSLSDDGANDNLVVGKGEAMPDQTPKNDPDANVTPDEAADESKR